MKASDLFVRALEAEGVRWIFAVPGEENLDFLESLRKSSIQLVVTRHEQGAGFMAATVGRLTGKAGVCLSTLGPGATNLLTTAAYAQLGAMPMVMITGQKPIRESKQGTFQIIDVVDMMAPITKYTRQVVGAGYLPARVREAFRRAEEERPGATHLEVPEDILQESVDGRPLEPAEPRRPVPHSQALEKAVELLASARHPLLVVASGANRTRTCSVLTDFVQRFGIPFITTQMGKGVVNERLPEYMGTAALSADDFVHRVVEAADVILNVGHNVVEKPPFIMHPHNGTQVIHLDFSSAQVDPVYFPQVEVTGDIASALTGIMAALEPQSHWDFSHLEPIRVAAQDHFQEKAEVEAFPLRPERLVAELRRAVPENGIVTLDNGMYKLWFARNYPTYAQNTLLLDNALATMGAGLPSAMAAAMVHPDRPVVAVCGDGGFMMNSQELETALRLKLNLVVLVLKDDAFGMIRWKQEHMGFEDFGLTYGNPDFVRYAEAYGARGHRVTHTGEFPILVKEALATPGVDLIEVPVDYSHDQYTLNEEIPKLARAL
ncbi:MAG: acetolactate synthase large subunit [Gemmatimonadota bacterium]